MKIISWVFAWVQFFTFILSTCIYKSHICWHDSRWVISLQCVKWKFQTFFNWHHFKYLAQQWTAWRITSFSSRMTKILLKVSKIWIILNCGNTRESQSSQIAVKMYFYEAVHKNISNLVHYCSGVAWHHVIEADN